MPWPVLTVNQMRAWESASWTAGIRSGDVIARVGRRIGEWLLAQTSPHDALIFLVGRGHNGDDARAAAQWIGWRRPQQLIAVPDPVAATEPIATALRTARRDSPRVWVIDGLFGIGLNREFTAPWRELIERLNDQTAGPEFRIVAIDVPSGLRDDFGGTAGAMVAATHTLTVGAPKRGLIGLAAAGRVEVLSDIGLIKAEVLASESGLGNSNDLTDDRPTSLHWQTGRDFGGFPPRRSAAAHKGSQGHLLIVAGSLGYHGAAVLAARAALRAGTGLVTVVCDSSAYGPIAAQLAQPMVQPWTEPWVIPESVTAVVIGPGLAARTLSPGFKAWNQSLWQGFPRTVLADASALDWIAQLPPPTASRLITPHPGEAARLLATTTRSVQADRIAAVQSLQKRYGGVVVLKGHHTLIANGLTVTVNPSGNPGLAQGGTGDVLTGFLGGWLARGIPADQAARYSVWEHGAAADRLGHLPIWTTEELIGAMR